MVEELAASLAGRAVVLDGEIVASGPDGRPDFSLLQRRMQLTSERDVERERRRTPVRLLLFDLLALDDTDRTELPYRERRELLERTIESGTVVQVPPTIDGSLDDALEVSQELLGWRG